MKLLPSYKESYFQAYNIKGEPLSGGKVSVFEKGTRHLVNCWGDETRIIPQPIMLDVDGRANIYTEEDDLTIQLEDCYGNTVALYDVGGLE